MNIMLWVHCILAEQAYTCYFTFLDLSFLICKIGGRLVSVYGIV